MLLEAKDRELSQARQQLTQQVTLTLAVDPYCTAGNTTYHTVRYTTVYRDSHVFLVLCIRKSQISLSVCGVRTSNLHVYKR